jgi:uncharacterized protein YbaR (Trm112 family)
MAEKHITTHEGCPSCRGTWSGFLDYHATTEVPCGQCKGPTIPPTPGHPEEQGYYCEECGRHTNADGTQGL